MTGQVVSASMDVMGMCLHDAAFDYYGKRAAAAVGAPPASTEEQKGEGDYSVFIWDMTDGQQKVIAQLQGHEGPIWKVAWGHPKYGSLLATCGYDMKIIIWKEMNGQWAKAYVDTSHNASVNDIEFCPWEYGLRLAAASSDGMVSVLTYETSQAMWRRSVFQAHQCGAQSISWAPVGGRDLSHGLPTLRLASGGCDNSVCIWKGDNEVWSQETPFLYPVHTDWVRKVAWRPDGTSTLASGSFDKQVVIWKQEMEGHPWVQLAKIVVPDKVESLSWSVTGSILGVAYGSGETVLYRESDDGSAWEEVGKCNEDGYVEVPKAAAVVNSVHMNNIPDAMPPATNESAAAFGAPPPPEEAATAQQQQSVLESFGMF